MPPKKGKGHGKSTQPEPDPECDVGEILAKIHPVPATQDDPAWDTPTEQQDAGDDLAEDETAAKRNKMPELEPAVEQALCEWFADHPLFYNMSDVSFKNRQRKDHLLDQKGKELNMRGDQLAIWWKSQRTMTTYGRLHKKKSGQAATRMTEHQKWNLTNFSFLKSHIAVRTVTKQLGKSRVRSLRKTMGHSRMPTPLPLRTTSPVPARRPLRDPRKSPNGSASRQPPSMTPSSSWWSRCQGHNYSANRSTSCCTPARTPAPCSASGSRRRRSACLTTYSGGSRRMCSWPS
uniref:uncharacterized protein n=1 Tax=Myxine glutinosa TaxID=7769 RepID=UPI00358F4CC3